VGSFRRQGVEVANVEEVVEVVYTGDTVMSGLLPVEDVWHTRMLIIEVTYLDGGREAAEKNQHIHLQDVLDNAGKFERIEQLVAAHVSERHGSHRNVLRLLVDALPPALINKVRVL
ncbi:unnamed protein product, partial [Discosporangium mesarthrocarpum]